MLGEWIGGEASASCAVERAIDALTSAGAPLIVAKLGAAGSRVAIGASRIDVPPLEVAAVDSTGAGDGFVAAFLFASARGACPQVAARIGNVVGALIASQSGAAEAAPCAAEVRRTLAQQDSHVECLAVFGR